MLLAQQRLALRDEMHAMTEQLVADYAATHTAGAVRRSVDRCRERLLVSGVRRGLVPATEAAARMMLEQTKPSRSRWW